MDPFLSMNNIFSNYKTELFYSQYNSSIKDDCEFSRLEKIK